MILNKTGRIILSIILLSGILVLAACGGAQNQGTAPRIDGAAPAFKLKNLSGQTVQLSDFKGRYVLLKFWSTTCAPCVNEMPHIQEFYQDLDARDDLDLLMVNLGESADLINNFMQSYNYTFPVVLDTSYKVSVKYGIRYTPTTVLIDAEGRVKSNVVGAFKNKAAIEKYLADHMQ